MKTALIAGATGATGNALVNQLIGDDNYQNIHIISRRPTRWRQHEKVTEHILPLERLADLQVKHSVDVLFCCLGTTIAKAKSKQAFWEVDHDAVVTLGEWAKANHVGQFHLVSAKGANPSSNFYYMRTKGSVERSLTSLKLPNLLIYHPSLLRAIRDDHRIGESLANLFLSCWRWLPGSDHWRPVDVEVLASSMIQMAQLRDPGVRVILESAQILKSIKLDKTLNADCC